MDGRFFRVTLLLDPRFEDFTRVAGGISPLHLDVFKSYLRLHVDGPLLEPLEAPPQPARFVLLAQAMTLGTVAIEGAIAAAFLWPFGGLVARARHALLLLFCTTVYAVATVEGFAWLLLAMGVSQCEPERRRTRLLYIAVFALVIVHKEVPWARMAAGLAGA
jgi:hypothetical protein